MPIFDNELIDNTSNRENPTPDLFLGSPASPRVNTNLDLEDGVFRGLTIDQLSQNRGPEKSPSFDSPFNMIPKGELLENKRYATYERGKDLENIYGLHQSWYKQLGNGIVKMAATAGGTFLQGFATIPDTVAAVKNGNLSDLSNPQGYESDIDLWLKNIEDRFPNFMTRKEKEHPYLAMIPGFAGSANFWGDKIIKNIGFTVGAIGSALVQDAIVGAATEGIGAIPLVGSQIGKLSLYLNKVFTGTNDLEKVLSLASTVGKTEKQVLNITKLAQLAAAQRVNSGFRYALSLYGSARTEAAVEARDGYRQVREKLINDYKSVNYGAEPSADEIRTIDNYATNAMNTRFGINMALLTVSNAVQFDNLFKSFTGGSVQRGIGSTLTKDIEEAGKIGLVEGSLDTFEKKAAKSFMGKVWQNVKPKAANIFSEGVYEEGGQYAAERGTLDYYTRKYKQSKDPEAMKKRNDFDEVIRSTVNGLKDQFGSQEGIENMIVGGLSAMITGGGMKAIDRMRGKGADKRLQTSINILNQYGLTGILHEKYTDTLNSVNIASEMQDAINSGNIFKFKNLKNDMFFGFVRSRVAPGMHDVTIEQLNMLKDLDKEQFEKTFGMDFSQSNKQTVNEYVDALIDKADKIKENTEALDRTYKNFFTFRPDAKTPEEVEENFNHNTFNNFKTNLLYFASTAEDTDLRKQEIQKKLLAINPMLTNSLVGNLTSREGLKELSDDYEEQANRLTNTITDSMSYADKKEIREQVKALRTMSEKVNMALNEGVIEMKTFGEILNFEVNGRDRNASEKIGKDKTNDLYTYGVDIKQLDKRKKLANNAFDVLSSEEGFVKFFEDEKKIADEEDKQEQAVEEYKKLQGNLPEFTNVGGVKEVLEKDREYQGGAIKKAKVRKIDNGRFKVTAPDGKVTFHTTREKAVEAAADINLENEELSKIKVLALNEDGTIKVEDSKGNVTNISIDRLTGYEKVQTEQEKMQKFAEQIENDQKDIENGSGIVGTGESDTETIPFEEPKKDAKILFISSTTESEQTSDPAQSAPHIKRSRIFLNNAKNFKNRSNLRAILVTPNQAKSLGLEGLVQMSYGVALDTAVSDIPGALDIDNGFVAQVYVEQDGPNVYFVDEEGNRLSKVGEQVDLDKVVFQTMPTTSTTYADGNSRFRSAQKEEGERYAKAWRMEREKLFSNPEGSYKLYSFTISRGFPLPSIKDANGRLERNPIGTVLVSENEIGKQEGLIQISVTGNIAHNGQNLNFPKGRPVLQYQDTFVPLNNRKFTNAEAATIAHVIKLLCEDIYSQSKRPGSPTIRFNRKYSSFLQGVLFWKQDITSKNSKNNMYIDTKTMNLYLGGKAYDITKIAESETAISEHLKETYNNVNNDKLTKTFSEPFTEYRLINGDLESVEWENYQTYLLSQKEPDGSTRSVENIPLATSVPQKTDAIPYSFQQKYSILEGLDLPIASVPTTPVVSTTPTGVPVVDGFALDGKTVHTYTKFTSGNVQFIAAPIDDKIGVLIQTSDPTVQKIAKNKEAMNNTVVPTLKALNEFDATLSDEQLVVNFLQLKIRADLEAKQNAATTKPAAAPTATATPAGGINISSNEKGFGAVLTNPTELAKSKGNLTKSYPVTFEGVTYKDAEEAYQKNKGKYTVKGKGPGSTYELMRKILIAKLEQHPEITDEITKRGGSEWLLSSKHQPTSKNTVWETGGENWFILALNDSYQDIISKPSAPTAPTVNVEAKKALGQELIGIVWDRLAKQGVTNADALIGTRETIDNIDFDKFWSNVTKEDLQNLKKQYETKKKEQLDLYNKFKGAFDPSTGTITSNDTSFFDNKIKVVDAELAALGGKTAPNFEIKPVSTDAKVDIERTPVVGDKFTGEDYTYTVISISEKGLPKLERIDKETGAKSTITLSTETINKFIKEGRLKYDAELAALGGKPAEPTTPPTPEKYDADDTETPDDDAEYRRIGRGERGKPRMTEADIELFKQWAAKNVPTIPFEVLEQIIQTYDNEEAWGSLEQGVVKFFRGAIKGTEYHEVFEAIWKYFLTDAERQGLINEFTSRSGTFTDRKTGKKYRYDDPTLTVDMVKERIADDFSDYRVNRLPAESIGGRFLQLVRRVYEFIKSFFTNTKLKNELFKAIDTGKYKEFKIPASAQKDAPEYRRVGNLSEQQTNDFIQDLTARAAQIIFGENDVKALFEPERLTSSEIFGRIATQKDMVKKKEKLGEEGWNELISETKKLLRTLGIDFNEEDRVNINDAETNNRDYAPEPFSTDWKKYSYFPVKILLATLVQRKPMNQENATFLEMPKADFDGSSVKGYKLINFSRTFATLMDKLSNTTGTDEVVSKLVELAKTDSNYVMLFKRLGGDMKSMTIDFSNYKPENWRLFVQFVQTFSKQKPNAIVQYLSGNEVYTGSAALTGASNTTKREWIERLKALAGEKDSIISYDSSTKTYKVKDVSGISIKEIPNQVDFLRMIGIDFPVANYVSLNAKDKNKFSKAVSYIHSFLSKTDDIYSISSKTLSITTHVNTLAELYIKATNPNQDTTHFNIDGNRTNSFAENNAPSVFENEFNEVKTLDQLLEKRPELKDVFSTHSVLLKKGGVFFDKDGNRTDVKLKIEYINGTVNVDKNKGTSTSKLGIGDRFVQELNQNLNGSYYVLIPADSSTEWMMNIGNQVSFVDMESGNDGWKKVYKIFDGYLKDDVAIALDYHNRSNLKYLGAKRGKELRFFKDILQGKILNDISNMIINGSTQDQINKYIAENTTEINAQIKEYINNTVKETRKTLEKNRKISLSSETTYRFPSLDNTFADHESIDKFNLTDDMVDNIILFANANYIINNIEMHKLIFGDPNQYQVKDKNGKLILDETKRIKSFLSPRRTTFDSPALRTFLNTEYNQTGLYGDENRITLMPGDYGYHQNKEYLNTVTAKDVDVRGMLLGKTKETDGASWLTIDAYREIKQRNGQWGDDAEKWYQWQMAYTRQNIPGYKYSDDKRGEALKKHDEDLVATAEPTYYLDVLKPIVSGAKYNKTRIDIVLDKFSQMPVYYKAVKGTNLENLYRKMFNEKIDYLVVESGRKVGVESLHDLYNPDGSFNNEAFGSTIQIPWKIYGIQVENSYEGGSGLQTRGSQVTKMVTMDLFEDGSALNPEIDKEAKRNKDLLDKLHTQGYKDLLDKLGIEDLGFSFKVADNKKVSEVLEKEMLRRQLSQNAMDTIQLKSNGEFMIPFEASTSYKQIKDILYSMVDKAIVSPKMNGGAHVQVPVTMWEDASKGRRLALKTDKGYKIITREEYDKLSDEQKEKVVLTDDTLKFYTKDDPYMEVMLPHWFKDKFDSERFPTDESILEYLNTDEGKEILKAIGFRIPTQATSSIESIRVKGFLPQSMGKTVVVPSEITTKAGSDFDIDKLSMYLKSVYVDADGDVRLVRYMGSEEATKEFYSEVYNNTIQKEIDRIEKHEDFRQNLVNIFEKIESMQAVTTAALKEKLTKDEYDFYKKNSNLLNEIISQAAEKEMNPSTYINEQIEKVGKKKADLMTRQLNEILRNQYVNDMYKRSLENEYYDSLQKLITSPEIFERLISPVDDAGLSDIADRLDELRGYDESAIKNRMLDRNYLTALRHAFVSAKKWIGIAAVNITHHALSQRTRVYVDPEMFKYTSKEDQDILLDGEISLPHNTMTVNGRSVISLSGRTDVDGNFISSGLSGFATAFVDVAKDPYIMKIIKNEGVVGLFMFATRIGIPKDAFAMFMNQPIIEEYLSMLEIEGTKNLFNKTNIAIMKEKFAHSGQGRVNVENFEKNISDYYENEGKLNDTQNAEQVAIFNEFLRLAKMADYSFKLSQATNYDTTKFKSGDTLFMKQVRTQIARETNIISSADKILDSSFIGYQELLLDYSMEAMGEILKLEQDQFRSITDKILEPYAKNFYMSSDDYEKIASKIKASFLDYVVQTKSNINEEIKRLLVEGNDVVATRIAKAVIDHPELTILKEFIPASSPRIGGAKSIELKVNLKDANDENLYIGMMRELRDSRIPGMKELYDDIVTLSILQGTQQSSISIKNIIPIEDYSAKISDIINSLSADMDVQNFSKGMFERNNWKDDDIFSTFEPRFYQLEDPIGIDPYTDEEIFEYRSYAFPQVKELGVTPRNRQIMLVSDKSFAANKDFIKIPRAIQLKDENGKPIDMWVDMMTSENIFKSDFAIRKKRGDLSLQNVYGYQRVRYEDGTPLTITNDKGYTSYVYRAINLYGDGQYATEHYLDSRPSVINNGTVKVEKELTDADIIKAFIPKTESTKPDISSPTSIVNTIEKKEEDKEDPFTC